MVVRTVATCLGAFVFSVFTLLPLVVRGADANPSGATPVVAAPINPTLSGASPAAVGSPASGTPTVPAVVSGTAAPVVVAAPTGPAAAVPSATISPPANFSVPALVSLPPVAAPSLATTTSVATAPATASAASSLFVEDGQLRSHPLRVFVNRVITPEMNPQLQLRSSHAFLKKDKTEDQWFPALMVAPNQLAVQEQAGVQVQLTGTTLLFDVAQYPMDWGKAMARVEPILMWSQEPGQQGPKPQSVIGSVVYLGNILFASLYSVLFILALVIMISVWARTAAGRAICLLCDEDGRLSLARVQVAAWTVAIGGMVFLYGIMRYKFHGIPESLLLLMGMSAVTTGVGVDAAARIKAGAKKTVSEAELDAAVKQSEAEVAEEHATQMRADALAAEDAAKRAARGTTEATALAQEASRKLDEAIKAQQAAVARRVVANQAIADATEKRAVADAAEKRAVANAADPKRYVPHFRDLIVNKDEGTPLSLMRAQLVFWTVLTLALFVTKSLLEGRLWEVPAQLVALMGLSQLSYVAPRLMKAATK